MSEKLELTFAQEKVLQPAARDSIHAAQVTITVAPMSSNAKFDTTLRETRSQAEDVEAKVVALKAYVFDYGRFCCLWCCVS